MGYFYDGEFSGIFWRAEKSVGWCALPADEHSIFCTGDIGIWEKSFGWALGQSSFLRFECGSFVPSILSVAHTKRLAEPILGECAVLGGLALRVAPATHRGCGQHQGAGRAFCIYRNGGCLVVGI